MSYQLIIAGGGITGLAAAYLAARDGKKVAVLEGSSHFGGLLRTFKLNGTDLEFFYHHFFTHDAEINWLVRELGLEDRLFFRKTTMGVFRNKKIYDFNSPADLLKFKPISLAGKIRFGLTSLYLGKMADWRKYENVPAIDWFYKYAGRSATDAIWKPMLDIKFGPYAGKVPLSWMIGRLSQRLNSRKGGDERLGYISGSLQLLLDTLLDKLRELGVELISEAPVQKILTENGTFAGFETPKGAVMAKQGLLTIPSAQLVPLFSQLHPETAEKLSRIEYFGAVCTILETTRPLSEVYWLNVADPGFPFGGVIEHTNFIPASEYQGSHITYLSRYFAIDDPLADKPAGEIEKIMMEKLPLVYPGFSPDWVKKVHVFRTMTAATVCDLNFSEKVLPCRLPVNQLYLAGMMHIYPDERSVNNSIRVAAEACSVMEINSGYVPRGSSLSGKIGFNS